MSIVKNELVKIKRNANNRKKLYKHLKPQKTRKNLNIKEWMRVKLNIPTQGKLNSLTQGKLNGISK